MAFEMRDGTGAMFRNRDKKDGTKQPDYRGDALFNGQALEIAGWLKETKKGEKFLSLAIKVKEARRTSAKAPSLDNAFI